MSALYWAKQKANQNIYLQNLWVKSKSVVKIVPFYLVQEGRFGDLDLNLKPKLDQYVVSLLKPSDIKTIAAHPEVDESEDILLERVANGCLCFCIMYKGDIAAYMWANLSKCESQDGALSFPLKKDEAYLFDARTFQTYRGKNLAPYLRYELYKYLEKVGRSNLYSITEFFNLGAIKFKKKLKVRPLKVYLHLILFKKYYYTFLLKRCRLGAP